MEGSMTSMTTQELLVVQKNGIDADNFLKGNEFYLKAIKPGVEYEREVAKKDGDWSPNMSAQLEAIALCNAFNSGKRVGLNIVDTICKRIMARGESAAQELDKRNKREHKDAV